ncbi:FecR family protein [Flaviflagellibacter deserti]|uniref:FecR domain-containing protein n=1 Tax=Flaviflagellibacter deserti TaxID=2267266 RepID=A0ABV9Z5E2_9HYPH
MIQQRIFPVRFLLTSLVAGAAVFTGGATATAAPEIGVSAAVRGRVGVQSSARTYDARAGDTMFTGDRVSSQANSGMQVLLRDETTFTIGADCQITLDNFVYDPNAGTGALAATVTKGALRYVSGFAAKNQPQNINLKTPSSTIGIRGTTADVLVGLAAIQLAKAQGYDVSKADPDTATFILLRGPGNDRNTIDREGGMQVGNGQGSVTISRNGFVTFVPSQNAQPLQPMRISPEVERLFNQNIQGHSTASGSQNSTRIGQRAADASGQSDVEGKSAALSSENLSKLKTTAIQDQSQVDQEVAEPPPLLQGSGVTNNIGLEIGTYEMAAHLGDTVTFSQTGAVLYDAGTRDRFGANQSINVYGAEGRNQMGSYDFRLTVTPDLSGPQVDVTFDNINAASRSLNGDSISFTDRLSPTTNPGFFTFQGNGGGSTSSTGCLAADCRAAADLIGNPANLITGATHSLQIGTGTGALLGTGVAGH